MPVRRVLEVSAVLAATVALGACGEDRNGERATTVPTTETRAAAGARGTPVVTVRVSETDYAIAPPNPRVRRAGILAFEVANDGAVVHALRVEGPAGDLETPAIPPGEGSAIRIDLPRGTYKWYCPIGDHEQRGMVGRVRVAE